MKKSDWNTTPGGYDSLHTGMLFESENEVYGIPMLKRQEIELPKFVVPYGTEVRRGLASARGGCCHFFLDDYRFESLWNQPVKTLNPIKVQGLVLTPDYSLFKDYPKALQIFNVYRNRWLGRFWQEQGVQVIPTVAWSDRSSYDFCFEGIPYNADIVAVSTVGIIRDPESRRLFLEGFDEMISRISPNKVMIYGNTFPELNELIESYIEDGQEISIKFYSSYWNAKKGKKENETKGEDD